MSTNTVLTPSNIEKGDKLKLYCNNKATDIQTYRIRGIVDNVIVAMYKHKNKHKWVYVLLTEDWLQSHEDELVLIKGKANK